MPRKLKSGSVQRSYRPTNSDLSTDLSVLTERVDLNHKHLCQQFEDGMKLVVEKLKPLGELETRVEKAEVSIGEQGKQISFWRGAVAVTNVVWASVLAIAAIVFRKH